MYILKKIKEFLRNIYKENNYTWEITDEDIEKIIVGLWVYDYLNNKEIKQRTGLDFSVDIDKEFIIDIATEIGFKNVKEKLEDE